MVATAKLLGVDSHLDADEVLAAIALLVGTLGGYYQMPLGLPIGDDALREMVSILGPAHVKVRRAAMVASGNLKVVDALRFEHVSPVGEATP